MVYFGKYLKDYLEFYDISQSEFAMRMGTTQKHMNELLNGKTNLSYFMNQDIVNRIIMMEKIKLLLMVMNKKRKKRMNLH